MDFEKKLKKKRREIGPQTIREKKRMHFCVNFFRKQKSMKKITSSNILLGIMKTF